MKHADPQEREALREVELNALIRDHNAMCHALYEKTRPERAELEAECIKELAALKAKHERKMDALQKKYKPEWDAINTKTDLALTALNKKYRAEPDAEGAT